MTIRLAATREEPQTAGWGGVQARGAAYVVWPLALLWLAQVAAALYWLAADRQPPYWDVGGHAVQTLTIARLPYLSDPVAALHGVLNALPYPPLVYLLAAPPAALSPTAEAAADAMLLVNALFWALLLAGTYGVAAQAAGRRAGLAAAVLISAYPMVYGLGRIYLLDLPMTAVAALAVWLLLRTDAFARAGTSLLFGLVCGLGMLTKWTFAIFLAGPVLVALWAALAKPDRAPRLGRLALAVAAGALVALPWYLSAYGKLRAFLPLAASVWAKAEGDPGPLSPDAWLYYINVLFGQQTMAVLGLLFVAGLLLALARAPRTQALAVLLVWIAVPFVVFVAYPNKDMRYTMPYLPAMAALTGVGYACVRPVWLRRALAGGALAWAGVQFAGLTFGLRGLPPELSRSVGPLYFSVYREQLHIATPPQRAAWPIAGILTAAVEDAGLPHQALAPDRERIRLLVLSEAAHFEPQAFTYHALAERLPAQITFVSGVLDGDDSAALAEADYIVAKSGDLGPAWAQQDAAAVRRRVEADGEAYTPVGAWALPDGSEATLYRAR